MAAHQGFEPRSPDPESRVLPLDEWAMVARKVVCDAGCWRKNRDSNPGDLSVRRLSKPVHLTTLPLFQNANPKACVIFIIKESPARAGSAVPTTLPDLPSAMPILTAAKPFPHAAVHPGWHSRSGSCRSSPEQPSRAPYSPPDFH
jgi:hypothetical protein